MTRQDAKSLEEIRSAYALEIAHLNKWREEQLSALIKPRSFEEAEHIRRQWGVIKKAWEAEFDCLVYKLAEFVAAVERDGFIVFMPVEPHHMETVHKLIAEARAKL